MGIVHQKGSQGQKHLWNLQHHQEGKDHHREKAGHQADEEADHLNEEVGLPEEGEVALHVVEVNLQEAGEEAQTENIGTGVPKKVIEIDGHDPEVKENIVHLDQYVKEVEVLYPEDVVDLQEDDLVLEGEAGLQNGVLPEGTGWDPAVLKDGGHLLQ